MDDMSTVMFEVTARTPPGVTVCVTGNHGSLGSFNPAEAREMFTDRASYPLWRTKVLLPRGAPLTYKYMTRELSALSSWETPNIQETRLFLPKDETETVNDQFGTIPLPPLETTNLASPELSPSPSLDAFQAAATSQELPEASLLSISVPPPGSAIGVNPSTVNFPPVIAPPGPVKVASTPRVETPSLSVPVSPKSIMPSSTPGSPTPWTDPSILIAPPLAGLVPPLPTATATTTATTTPTTTGASTPLHAPETSAAENTMGALALESSAASAQPVATGVVTSSVKTSNRLILLAFNLPIKLRYIATENGVEKWGADWDADNVAAKTEHSVATSIDVTWIGALTPYNTSLPPGEKFTFVFSDERRRAIHEALAELKNNVVPIFLEERVYDRHFSRFCKQNLWDIFHNVLRYKASSSSLASFETYKEGNRIFANEAMRQAFRTSSEAERNKNVIIWVHDYHLMLVPKMLRDYEASPFDGPILFFLHVPFPTSEIFRTLSVRHELLEGVLSASTIGFHTFNHGRHFITACKRFLGASAKSKDGFIVVEHGAMRVMVTIAHLGVDANRLEVALTTETTRKLSIENRDFSLVPAIHEEKGTRCFVFGSLDSMHRLRGVPLKLLAFERLLAGAPNLRSSGRVRFVLWAVTPMANKDSIDGMSHASPRLHDVVRSTTEVRKLVKRINDSVGWKAVILREFHTSQPPTLEERVGLWLSLDCFVHTAVSEGLNLMPLEYVYVRGPETPGIVIVSEFATVSNLLNGAVRVNCYNISGIGAAMEKAMDMPIEERRARRARDRDYISYPASSWAQYLLDRVVRIASADDFVTTIDARARRTNSTRSLPPRVVKCPALVTADVKQAFQNSKRRVLFFDFGSTLVAREQENLTQKKDFLGARGRGLSAETKKNLELLCRDPRNVVFVVSQDSRTVLQRVFLDLICDPDVPLGLVTHTGLCIRFPSPSILAVPRKSKKGGVSAIRLRPQSSMHEGDSAFYGFDEADSPLVAVPPPGQSSAASGNAAMTLFEEKAILCNTPANPEVSPSTNLQLSASDVGESTDEDEGALNSSGARLPIRPVSAVQASPWGSESEDDHRSGRADSFTETADRQTLVERFLQRQVSERGAGVPPLGPVKKNLEDEWDILPTNGTSQISSWNAWRANWNEWMNRAGIVPILKRFEWTTGGATIAESSAITTSFDYSRSDPEWGLQQANIMVDQLNAALDKAGLEELVDVRHTRCTVQLLPKGVDKGAAAKLILENLKMVHADWQGLQPDFCLCLGDDVSDEFMFEAVQDYFDRAAPDAKVFSATVGRKSTSAGAYVRDVDGVHALLRTLVQAE